jgi:hypothetical protein
MLYDIYEWGDWCADPWKKYLTQLMSLRNAEGFAKALKQSPIWAWGRLLREERSQ